MYDDGLANAGVHNSTSSELKQVRRQISNSGNGDDYLLAINIPFLTFSVTLGN